MRSRLMLAALLCCSPAAMGCGNQAVESEPETETVSEADRHSDFTDILGTWVVVSSEREGEPNDEAVGNRFTFREDKLSAWLQDYGDFNVDYTIDPHKDPKNFDFELGPKPDPSMHRGIYALEGDKLKLCFMTRNRPTSFETKQGDPWISHVLERSADED